ncbi:hypothetical protein JBW_03032 [Pelosinus fermentans JBW45]|uniref:Uncharacterized protein n=1 Tax=Pelosinus fermentans JBW45 TaxID=1192197 RepID=I9DFI7_9FIRM|nr:hypothetical protein JBW_03032 [Pelosinus fermentans JBW45]
MTIKFCSSVLLVHNIKDSREFYVARSSLWLRVSSMFIG